MKRILIVCLLGMGLLLPTTTITAKHFSTSSSAARHAIGLRAAERNHQRIVSVTVEGDILFISSDATTGTLIWAKIYDEGKTLKQQGYVTGYSDVMDVSSLTSGNYSVTVHTTTGNYYRYFTL